MANEDQVVQFPPLYDIQDVSNMGVGIDPRMRQMAALSQTCQGRGMGLVTLGFEELFGWLPTPSSVPGSMNQKKD